MRTLAAGGSRRLSDFLWKDLGGADSVRSLQATDWRGGLSAKVGLEFGRPRPERRGLTVLLEYFDGSAPFGQFYRDVVSYYGVGVQFDY